MAARGSVLEPGALRAIGRSIGAALAARVALESSADIPGLSELAAGIDPALSAVADELERAVEDDGSDLRDGASPVLRRATSASCGAVGRASPSACAPWPATPISASTCRTTSSRSGRGGRCSPCGRRARGAVPGIVHDSSATGQTLFVEPLAVIEESNRLREAESAEREEVARILRALSQAVGAGRARARLARRGGRADRSRARLRRCSRVAGAARRFVASDAVALRGARHPLLDPVDGRRRSTSSSATCVPS